MQKIIIIININDLGAKMDSNQTETTQVPTLNQSLGTPITSTNTTQKPKGLIIGMVMCVIFAIVGIAFGVYCLIQINEKSKELTNLKVQIESEDGTIVALDTNETVISDDGNTITIIDPMKYDTSVRKVVDVMQEVATEISGVGDIRVYDRQFPLVKDPNAKTLLRLEKSYGLYAFKELDDIEKSTAIAEAINKKLKGIGFVDNEDIIGPAYITGGSNLINHDSGIVCNISGGLPFTAECSHASWISSDTISFANKLADAFFAVENSYPFSIDAKNYTIKDSPISPYQTLEVSISNGVGLFYRTSPDKDWTFFAGTQAELDCSKYDTQDLKNAFSGEICYDRGQSATVQP